MYQKDFILRMLEMLTELIAGILGLIKKGDFQKASQFLDNAYTEFLKQDAALFRNIPKDQMLEDLLKEHNYTNDHLEMLADLFYAEAMLRYAMENRNESREFYEKAIILLEFIERQTNIFSVVRQSKISNIQNQLTTINNKTS